VQTIEKIYDAVTKLVFQIELFTLGDVLSALQQHGSSGVNLLKEVLCCGFQQQNLIVVIPMMTQIAAFFTYKLTVHAAKCYIRFVVELTTTKRNGLVI